MSKKAANDNLSAIGAATRGCPICGKPATVEMAPFCSKRCADVDLHRWLGESYRVPVQIDDEDDTGALPED